MNGGSDNTYLAIDLHLHSTRWEGESLLLSRDGVRSHAHHIPKSLLAIPSQMSLDKVGNETSRKGRFGVQQWKLKQLGWLHTKDESQAELTL